MFRYLCYWFCNILNSFKTNFREDKRWCDIYIMIRCQVIWFNFSYLFFICCECILLLLWYTWIWKYHKLTYRYLYIFFNMGENVFATMTIHDNHKHFFYFFYLLFGSLKFLWWREIFTKLKYITSYYEVMTFFVCFSTLLFRGEKYMLTCFSFHKYYYVSLLIKCVLS